MEQFVDGQILLNDITAKNLISDLEVKSLHAPKIMRELNKLKRNMSTTLYKLSESSLTIEEEVTDFTAPTTSVKSQLIQELETQTQQLKNDLSESRMRMRQLQIQIDEYKINANKKKRNPSSMTMKSIGSMNSIGNLPNLSPQSSAYSQGIYFILLTLFFMDGICVKSIFYERYWYNDVGWKSIRCNNIDDKIRKIIYSTFKK